MTDFIVTIRTGARLHFGPLSFRPETGRHFGGLGLMIDAPRVMLTVRRLPAGRDDVVPSPRLAELLRCLRAQHGRKLTHPLQITLHDEIPPHRGLGSGTQLALAVVEAAARLQGWPATLEELARLAERGLRSAIGAIGYQQGGFVVDAGHRPGAELGELACRLPFPPTWRILLVTPRDAVGVHGPREQEIFDRLPAMSRPLQGELARLALTEILPAVQNTDFPAFAQALGDYGRTVGRFFAGAQQGIFADEHMAGLAECLEREGIDGIVQSSWGPSLAIFCRDETQATEVHRLCASLPSGTACRYQVTQARNTGRTLTLDRSLPGDG
jgi:beta-ribofuranosylaminobenzene 5'-phosphate synthase